MPQKKAGLDFEQKIVKVLAPADQPSKFWMFIPGALLLALVVMLQRRRQDHSQGDRAAST
ncbi:MAG: hypothetical protein ACI9DC_003522 [Gammaproteobacteria bacterium]